MIRLQHISKTFGKGTPAEVAALKDVTLDIPDGQFVVVLGANGSGKSTLLGTMAGTVQPDKGTVSIGAEDITRLPDYRRSQYIARIFQNPLLNTSPDLTILENFRLAALRTRRKGLHIGTGQAFRETVAEKIATLELGLESKLDQAMGTLSGGQRQSLALLMSVMDSCKILLLDEPTAALDPRTAGLVMSQANKLIRQFSLTAVLITHQMTDALRYGDRVMMMSEGMIIKDVMANEKDRLSIPEILRWFDME